jgi:hypothetical protein
MIPTEILKACTQLTHKSSVPYMELYLYFTETYTSIKYMEHDNQISSYIFKHSFNMFDANLCNKSMVGRGGGIKLHG